MGNSTVTEVQIRQFMYSYLDLVRHEGFFYCTQNLVST